MEGRKRISCQRCQLRKSRCNRVYPCHTCTDAGAECKFRDDDSKRRPVGRGYVVALEEKVSSYESLVRRLKVASDEERTVILDKFVFEGDLALDQNQAAGQHTFDYSGSSRMSTMSLEVTPEGSRVFYGPTSIYQKSLASNQPRHTLRDQSHRNIDHCSSTHLFVNMNITDEVIAKTMSLFFRYQYPQFMFICQEAFLEDYYDKAHSERYWSYPLLYAMCALGARMSSEVEIREKGDILSRSAQEMLDNRDLQHQDFTAVQALLCLAFYELGGGNHSKGWLLSGMAFRMAQDLGFQQDPKFWAREDSAFGNERDMEIRRRIYWGCYVADKFISLYLGRPVYLNEEDASVDPLGPLMGAPELHTPQQGLTIAESDMGYHDAAVSFSVFEGIVELSKVIQDILSQVFGTKMIKKIRQELVLIRSARVEELNLRLLRWYSNLPQHLAWNQWTPLTEPLKPHVAILHGLYHSILISLHRHFVRPTPGFALRNSSKEMCIISVDSIIAMLRQFRAQHGLQNSPIVVVYSAVMAASAISFTQDTTTALPERDRQLKFILKVLKECSETHRLAGEARRKLLSSMDMQNNLPTTEEQPPPPVQPDQQQELQQNIPSYMIEEPPMEWIGGGAFDFIGQLSYDVNDPFFEYGSLYLDDTLEPMQFSINGPR